MTLHSSRKSALWGSALLLLAVVTVVSVVWSGTVLSAPDQVDATRSLLQQQSDGAVHVDLYGPTGTARWVYADQGVLTREFAQQAAAPESRARAFMERYGALFGIEQQAERLQLAQVETDIAGRQNVRFSQVEKGVKVFGADLIVHLNADGAVTVVNGYTLPNTATLNTTPTLQAQNAGQIAVDRLGVQDGFVAESTLVLLNPGLITDQPSDTYLTYRVRADSEEQPHLAEWIFVDAMTGDVRFRYPAVTDGRNRQTYNMQHRTNYSRAVLARSEGQGPVSSASSCTATDVNNAHDYAGNTYDFYFNRYGRDSYDNHGAALRSYVCYGSNYQNAFWDGSRMTYGNGFAAADDVVAHELSHAVTEHTSNLVYSYQSGALNESFSDIFGESIDLTNGSGTDTNSVRWDMGEDIPGIGAIRDMLDPTRFGDPDRTNSSNMYCGSSDSGGVHTNSGVPNKAYALMVDGGSFNGYTMTGIGIDAAAAIAYRTNAVYLTSSAKFLDAYNGFLQACSDLYGAGSAQCTTVRSALEATKMNGPVCGSGGATPTPSGPTATPTKTPTPTNTPPSGAPTATPTATPASASPLINGDFESGRKVGWSETSSHNYALVMSGAGENSSWGAWLGGANRETSEIVQSYAVPATGGTLIYAYRISSSDACGYDYGYVKVNSKNLVTYKLCSSNATNGFVQGSVSLNAYAGKTVKLKFRTTTDASYVSSFYIDNVSVAGGAISEVIDPHAGAELTTPESKSDSPRGVTEERTENYIFLPMVQDR